MAIEDIRDPNAVRAALREFDELGREAFLTKYGFGGSDRYFVVQNGKRYDAKAIVGGLTPSPPIFQGSSRVAAWCAQM